jgi:hypothetical protein
MAQAVAGGDPELYQVPESATRRFTCCGVSPNGNPASACVSRLSVTASTTCRRWSARFVNSIVSSGFVPPSWPTGTWLNGTPGT